MTIREASLDDVSALVGLGIQFYGREGCDEAFLSKFAIDHIIDDNKNCWVLLDKSDIVGVLCCGFERQAPSGNPVAYKSAWFVKQGKRWGAKGLLARFESWALDKGAKRLLVTAREPRTVTMLEKLGYSPTELVVEKFV